MPTMDGLSMLRRLNEKPWVLAVIMFSTLTKLGAQATLDALSLGAKDYVTKPNFTGGLESSLTHVRRELAPRIKAIGARVKIRRAWAVRQGTTDGGLTNGASAEIGSFSQPRQSLERAGGRPTVVTRTGLRRVDILGIGVSTGGPAALAQLLPALVDPFPVPIAIVQHMPPFLHGCWPSDWMHVRGYGSPSVTRMRFLLRTVPTLRQETTIWKSCEMGPARGRSFIKVPWRKGVGLRWIRSFGV